MAFETWHRGGALRSRSGAPYTGSTLKRLPIRAWARRRNRERTEAALRFDHALSLSSQTCLDQSGCEQAGAKRQLR